MSSKYKTGEVVYWIESGSNWCGIRKGEIEFFIPDSTLGRDSAAVVNGQMMPLASLFKTRQEGQALFDTMLDEAGLQE